MPNVELSDDGIDHPCRNRKWGLTFPVPCGIWPLDQMGTAEILRRAREGLRPMEKERPSFCIRQAIQGAETDPRISSIGSIQLPAVPIECPVIFAHVNFPIFEGLSRATAGCLQCKKSQNARLFFPQKALLQFNLIQPCKPRKNVGILHDHGQSGGLHLEINFEHENRSRFKGLRCWRDRFGRRNHVAGFGRACFSSQQIVAGGQ